MKVPQVKSYKSNEDQPTFPKDFEIIKNCVLQLTEIKNNHNKYYALELHQSKDKKKFRLFTHYGRTDDIQS